MASPKSSPYGEHQSNMDKMIAKSSWQGKPESHDPSTAVVHASTPQTRKSLFMDSKFRGANTSSYQTPLRPGGRSIFGKATSTNVQRKEMAAARGPLSGGIEQKQDSRLEISFNLSQNSSVLANNRHSRGASARSANSTRENQSIRINTKDVSSFACSQSVVILDDTDDEDQDRYQRGRAKKLNKGIGGIQQPFQTSVEASATKVSETDSEGTLRESSDEPTIKPRENTKVNIQLAHSRRQKTVHFCEIDDRNNNFTLEDGRQTKQDATSIDVELLEMRVEEEAGKVNERSRYRLDFPQPAIGCQPLPLPWRIKEDYKLHLKFLIPGKCVELKDGSFLHIAMVSENVETNEIVVRGWRLRRVRELKGLIPKGRNELCYIFEQLLDDHHSVLEQSIEEVKISDVRQHREWIRTNHPYPEFRFSLEDCQISKNKKKCWRYAEENLKLAVRWKYTSSYRDQVDRARSRKMDYPFYVAQRRLERLTEEECTEGYYMPLSTLRSMWREGQMAGDECAVVEAGKSSKTARSPQQVYNDAGALQTFHCPRCRAAFLNVEHLFQHFSRCKELVGTSSTQHEKVECRGAIRIARKGYTFGDAFCGCGGATAGAKLAGLLVRWGLDYAQQPGKTWRANHPGAEHYEMMIFDMLTKLQHSDDLRVDVLHISPPCQPWSPVHTRPGKDDEANIASLYVCSDLLKVVRPRFATLEQTFGILLPVFESAFNCLIQQFTVLGYSVSWQILEFQRYGLGQRRRRCIMVAAGPGETLPPIPPYTHSDQPASDGLLPCTTAGSILRSIPHHARNHDITLFSPSGPPRVGRPCDPSLPLPTITCDGGLIYHPNGLRRFTHRELAAFQGFPHDYVFHGTCINKQIGNSVPPLIAQKVLFEPIVRHMRQVDGAADAHSDKDVIILD